MLRNQKSRDFVVVFSLVNLSFLVVWRELIFADASDAYWIPRFTNATHAAVLVNLVWLSLLLWGAGQLVRRSGNRTLGIVARLGFLALCVFPLNYLRLVLGINSSTAYWIKDNVIVLLPILIVALGLTYFLVLRISQLARFLAMILLLFSPFAVITASQAAWKAVAWSDDSAALSAVEQGDDLVPASTQIRQRVVWLLFDELDLRLAFTNRPEGLELPQFDHVLNQSLFALEGASHSKNTEEAIPSFITSKLVAKATPIASNALDLHLEEGGPVKGWKDYPTIFSQAHSLGAKSAVVGLYHPYCRVFSGDLTFCTSYSLNTYTPQSSDSIFAEMGSQLAGITPLLHRINGIRTYRGMLDVAPKVAADSTYDLVYVHASVPHGPDIYDPRSGELTWFNFSKDGYLGNLVLADRLLGEIRRSMEATGVWDESVVVITSDHEWRHVHVYDNIRVRKIPFLVKTKGQTESLTYDASFSPMLVAKDMTLALMKGEISDAPSTARWLDQKREVVGH